MPGRGSVVHLLQPLLVRGWVLPVAAGRVREWILMTLWANRAVEIS